MISFDNFLDWAKSRFDNDVVVRGGEIKLNSIFTNDYKHHMWCSPSGGKNNRPFGVYRCWKTDKRGSLIKLVMLVDRCSFGEALEKLKRYNSNYSNLEQEINDLSNNKQEIKINEVNLTLPPYCQKIKSLPPDNYWRKKAETYLDKRLMNIDKFYICTKGNYANRIIIPYYDNACKLIYFNSRYIGANTEKIKYLGPPKSSGVGKSDVIYFPKWAPKGSKIYITEGEFDAESIYKSGLYSAALGGKVISERQFFTIYENEYTPVLCLDNDTAGNEAYKDMWEMLALYKLPLFVEFPKSAECKDWNDLLIKTSENVIRAYLEKKEHAMDIKDDLDYLLQ